MDLQLMTARSNFPIMFVVERPCELCGLQRIRVPSNQ